MVLRYLAKYHVRSAVQVATAGGGWFDDTGAVLNFTLPAQRVALILYNATAYDGTAGSSFGGQLAINIDGTRQALIDFAPFINNDAWGGNVVWLGTLASGVHTITGQIQRRANDMTIDDRRLLVVIFKGTTDDFRYVRSTNVTVVNGTAFGNDTEATATFVTPASKALVIYNVSLDGATQVQSLFGIRTRIDVDTVYQSSRMEHPWAAGDAHNAMQAIITTLTAGNHTFTGQHAANQIAENSRVSEHQLAILIFDSNLETDFDESTTTVSIAGNVLGNDTQASIARATTATRYVLAIYSVTKLRPNVGATTGKKVAINIDGADYVQTGQRTTAADDPNHKAYFTDIVTVVAGAHTVDGRFAAYQALETARVDNRLLCVLWFPEYNPAATGNLSAIARIIFD